MDCEWTDFVSMCVCMYLKNVIDVPQNNQYSKIKPPLGGLGGIVWVWLKLVQRHRGSARYPGDNRASQGLVLPLTSVAHLCVADFDWSELKIFFWEIEGDSP